MTENRENAAQKKAAEYIKEYGPWMNQIVDKSPLAKVRPHGVTAIDVVNAGQMFEKWDVYQKYCEDTGNLSNLGQMPNVAKDILAVNFGASPINVIASVQPMEDLQGFVAFKDWVAQNTRGNVTSGQKLLSTLAAPDVFPGAGGNGYMTDAFATSTLVSDGGGTASYTNLTVNAGQDFVGPIDPRRCVLNATVVFSGGTAVYSGVIADPSSGNFSQMVNVAGTWIGMHGVVNFKTGVVTSLAFTQTPSTTSNATLVQISYNSIPEANTDIQSAILQIVTKPIAARFFHLKATFGTAEKFLYSKRYNMDLDGEVAQDLTVSINNEIMNTAVGLLTSNIPGANVSSWERMPTDGISYFEHLPTLKYALNDNAALMVKTAGRGTVNTLVAGRKAAAILKTLPGFVQVFDDNSFGPHIYGHLDGMVVVRVPYSTVLNDLTIIGLYQGPNNYEAPLVYSPLMPLYVTNTMQMGFNPFQNQRAAASWAGLDPLISNFSTQLNITETDFSFS
jgi:hypothetical protein